MKKTNKHNIKSNGKAKNVCWNKEYFDTKTLQMMPANDQFFERKALELVTWARENPNAFYIQQFCCEYNILERTLDRWIEDFPCMKNAHEAAMQYLAIRNQLYLKEKDPSSVRYIMPQISKMWLKEDIRRAAQREKLDKQNKNNGPIIVNIPVAPNSDLVPEKKNIHK